MSLSDRDFMRAKDFYYFFSTLPFTVMDPPSPQISAANKQQHRVTNWRIVNDLRMVIPGDILVYRPEGGAAGGAAFTTADRQDVRHLLQAVKTAELWNTAQLSGGLVTQHNVAKEPPVHEWVAKAKSDLAAVGIVTVKCLYDGLNTLQLRLKEKGLNAFNKEILDLMKQCYEATSDDTGHIVFVSGPAVNKGNDEYRVRVVHSTKYGNKNENGQVTTGVQEYYRRFVLKKDEHAVEYWTRKQTAVRDEVAGQANVEVLAARMCF
jgi:hypothetical protein